MILNPIVHEDEITVWWDKEWSLEFAPTYRVSLNGKEMSSSKKTYATLCNLDPDTDYTVRVERDGALPEEIKLHTGKKKRRIDVSAAPYFAKGDGKTLNTEVLQRAIDACTAEDCLYFPAGIFMTGALDLHSDMEVYLDEGAVLQGRSEISDYLPKQLSRFEGTEMMCYRSLLNLGTLDHKTGANCKNVIIRGKGAILGGGAALAEATIVAESEELKDFLAANADYVKTCENDKTIPGRVRGRLISMNNCDNVIICGLRLGFAASWNLHFIYSKNIVTYGCKIESIGVWNGDGWDPDSSEYCTAFNCEFQTHDNSIAIKSGKNPEGNKIARPTREVRIFDCRGRECMALGSEMSGGLSEIYIWDCDFSDSRAGLGIKVTQKRGGYIRNIKIADSVFSSIRARSVSFNDDGEGADTVSRVYDVLFKNITLTGISVDPTGEQRRTEPLYVVGLEGEENYFEDFTFDGLFFKPLPNGEAQRIELKNLRGMTVRNLSFE